MAKIKLLTFSTLFPNTERPNHGVFVETRLRHLIAGGKVESCVVAPIPWFPFQHHRFGQYASYARIPSDEIRFGIKIIHPRYPLLPKVGMTIAPFFLANALKPAIGKIIDAGYNFDLIDAHYFYPDGVAAVKIGQYFNKPVVITARGSDITIIPQYRRAKKMILWAAKNSDRVIAVCNALKDEMVELGVDATRITALRNGVDLKLFHPLDRAMQRKILGMHQFTLLSVGHLESHKGHDVNITALPMLSDVCLFIAGSGSQRKYLEKLAQRLHVADRVIFLGSLPQAILRKYYGAADALVLTSSREGWANVLLESMACGTPVIASNVWGTPEVVASPDAGILMSERTPQGLIEGVHRLRADYPHHDATRRYAEKFSWDDTTQGQIQLFEKILAKRDY